MDKVHSGPDPMFRQRLRRDFFDYREQLGTMTPGSAAWHDCDRLMRAAERLHVTLYGEAVVGVHSAGETRKPPAASGR